MARQTVLVGFLILGCFTVGTNSIADRASAQDSVEPSDAAASDREGLEIAELTLAKGYEQREPVEPTTAFSVGDGRVWVVLRVKNTTGSEATIRVTFETASRDLGEVPVGGVTLTIPPSTRGYRTVARTALRRAGSYRVVVRTESGAVLQSADYQVE